MLILLTVIKTQTTSHYMKFVINYHYLADVSRQESECRLKYLGQHLQAISQSILVSSSTPRTQMQATHVWNISASEQPIYLPLLACYVVQIGSKITSGVTGQPFQRNFRWIFIDSSTQKASKLVLTVQQPLDVAQTPCVRNSQ